MDGASDRALARRAVDAGLVDEAVFLECLREQEAEASAGRTVRRAERAAEAGRAERSAQARTRVGEARAALASGALDRAIVLARAVSEDFAEAQRRGEDVGVLDAFDLLVEAYAKKGDSAAALRERYRSYRAAIGSPSTDAYLLKVAAELIDRDRCDEALPLVRQALRRTTTPARVAHGGGAGAPRRPRPGRARLPPLARRLGRDGLEGTRDGDAGRPIGPSRVRRPRRRRQAGNRVRPRARVRFRPAV
ncbi:MAG: hypothetical protein HYZ53_15850 [Planctomycetes bacterium]|nr:hypothetical protein [Planctomycetota bacterium]